MEPVAAHRLYRDISFVRQVAAYLGKAAQNDTLLDQLEVLAVDCQAISANPDTGQSLEISFMAGSAVRPIR